MGIFILNANCLKKNKLKHPLPPLVSIDVNFMFDAQITTA